MYTPETASDGTAHDADTAQFPQSYNPVVRSFMHAGWDCGTVADGVTDAM